jgi:hypothetical protein
MEGKNYKLKVFAFVLAAVVSHAAFAQANVKFSGVVLSGANERSQE